MDRTSTRLNRSARSDPRLLRDTAVGPHESVLWASDWLVVGRFDASPGDPQFATSGRVGARAAVAFSRTAVRISPEGREPFVSDPTLAVLHNPAFPYTRSVVDPRGDHCLWLSLSRDVLAAVAPVTEARPATPFTCNHVPIDAPTHLRLHFL